MDRPHRRGRRAGLALARPHLTVLEVDGVEHYLDPSTPGLLTANRADARGVHLLPGFDEMVLGYRWREATVPAEHAQRIVPGNNGVFRPTVVAHGRAVGTWRRAGDAVAAAPFTKFTGRMERAIAVSAERLPWVAVRR